MCERARERWIERETEKMEEREKDDQRERERWIERETEKNGREREKDVQRERDSK